MKTKVNNCGNYDCVHCSSEGQCLLSSISLDNDGKCILFKKISAHCIPIRPMGEY